MKIVLIGAGNVAFHLGTVLKKKGHKIIQVYSRTKNSSRLLARRLRCHHTNKAEVIISEADIYIVALRDEAISSFLSRLRFSPELIVHTSGSTDLNVFPSRMKNTGVLYPLQTFSKTTRKNPEIIPFCIEGSNLKSLTGVRRLADSISPCVYRMNSSERHYVHLSAVFANNFTNHLFTLAGKILSKKKIPFDILGPLILETALKVQNGKPGKMQTGPAMRGDAMVVRQHLRLLKEFPEMKVIYNLLSKSIQKDF